METAGSSNALDVSTPTQDLKFMQASNINVSNFVSVKLSGRSNYKIWKAQLLCLIESQLLLHIIDSENEFPVDKGVHMIGQYDKLVKGWIFGSVNEKVLKDLVDLGTAQMVWMKIDSLFNLPVSDTEGTSSNALDVSAPEDLKYLQALNVDVSNFVSEKLEGTRNYYTWKNEMLYLLGIHELLPIIQAKEARFPWNYKDDPMAQKYDSLVRGWILNTMNDRQCSKYRRYRSVQLMWRRLESTFTYQPETSNSINTKDDSSNEKKNWIYKKWELNVNVSNFVWVKLSGRSNYEIWKAQMLCLIESQDLLHTINSRDDNDIFDEYAKNLIIRTLNEELLEDFDAGNYFNLPASSLWEDLESRFKDSDSMPEPVTQDLKYTQALNATVSNFVSVKLTGSNNYEIWKAQVLCLIQSHNLLHIIESKDDYTTNKYKHLVKGWIFSTMNEQLLNNLTSSDNLADSKKSAKDVWVTLQKVFDAPKSNGNRRDRQDPQELTFGIEFIKDDTEFVSELPESDSTDKKRLYKVAVEGLWRKVKSIFKINKKSVTEAVNADIERKSSRSEYEKKELYEAAAEGRWRKAKSILENGEIAATEAITANGNTILHVAVENGHNYFVEKLLEILKDGEDTEKINDKGRTALHIAAMVGNTNAAQLLVQKSNQLLLIEDHNNYSPLHLASQNMNVNTYAYLFKSLSPSNLEDLSDWTHSDAILAAIFSKQYDIVEKFLQTMSFDFSYYGTDILMAMTITFPTDLRFTGAFIYPSFRSVCHKAAMRGSLLFNPDRCVDDILRVVNMCNSTCCSWLGKDSTILIVLTATLYTMYQLIFLLIMMLHLSLSMLYLLLWKVLAVTVQPIKNIEKKKKMYKEAKKVLRMICKKTDQSHLEFTKSLFEAVRLDIYEVVDEILYTSPPTINCKDEDGHNIIQASILNRAENVYNLIYHIIERTKSHSEMIDSSSNNLGHLAGKLAPPFSLSRTTGAALQLQRELLWFEEVKKLVLPLQLTKKNIYKETPAMVFTREHEALLRQGEIWMKTTAESCSITVALIVTVVFAASITVPGGNQQESGIPMFKKEISFTIFALANAFSLFTGATSLLLFLSILTARSSEKDFLVSLPRRLIFGLLTLFLSTISMIVAFGAILFLVFCDKRPWMLAPICVSACLPISIIVTIKLPLLVDLIQSTYFPRFGKKRYIKGCKVNRKNTIFTK